MTRGTSAQDFIDELRDKEFMRRMLPSLAGVRQGNWEEVVELARREGFDFTAQELKASVPLDFFKGSGKNPESGWDVTTR